MVFEAPGIRQPRAFSAGEVALEDSEAVIGVTEGGHSRAYLVSALANRAKHVVNDVLGGIPVSVTYCSLRNCVRVFQAFASHEPLDLSVGGLQNHRLVLKSGGHAYLQESGAPLDLQSPAFPYEAHPWELTSWGAWRKRHPETDVYVGGQ
jgi:hypothetical protein